MGTKVDVAGLVRMARHVARRVRSDAVDVNDMVQECLLRGLECVMHNQVNVSFIYKAMFNTALNMVMREELRAGLPLEGDVVGDGSPELAISRKLFVGATKVARAYMPDALRDAANVMFEMEMNVREGAGCLGVSEMTLLKRIERVRKWWRRNKEFCEQKAKEVLG